MEKEMGNRINIYLSADHIISALGFGTQENVDAIRSHRPGIKMHKPGWNSDIADTPIWAATIDNKRLADYVRQYQLEDYTRLEQLFILSITETLAQSATPIDLAAPDCCILFSTTKGNIDQLNAHDTNSKADAVSLWQMAERVSGHFDAGQNFRIISNACISGVSALIVAKRMMEEEGYRKVIVTGGDILSHFITSGFLSFKSISDKPCRPFDIKRDGLTLGEGCGTILLTTQATPGGVVLSGGGISNDANHISGPSRTGDGLYYAIRQAMDEAGVQRSDIGFVNTHGTATVYNDEMESKAIHLAGLQRIWVNSMKSYLGHTLGAAGVIETIICAHELKTQTIFGTLGLERLGVPMHIAASAGHIGLSIHTCVKTASGFGGCNAAIVLTTAPHPPTAKKELSNVRVARTVTIKNGQVCVDEQPVVTSTEASFGAFIREVYKTTGESNMKFYKMDDLCKLGYMAAHYALEGQSWQPTEIGIVLANRNASVHTDIKHQEIINEGGDAAASPAVFVYTLPNVVAGEICIRYKIQGENTFFISKACNLDALKAYARTTMQQNGLTYCLVGWCELSGDNYDARFELLTTI